MTSASGTYACLPCAAPIGTFDTPTFTIPEGATDTHAHVVAAVPEYPMIEGRSYTPPPAPEHKYLAMLDALGMDHGVLVQISVYGTDNRYMLDVLRRNPGRLRGVAVVNSEIGDRELRDMHEAGVRGLRINVLFGGGIDFSELEKLAHRIKEFGWHMQLLMDVQALPELMPRMLRLPVPAVFDHMGHTPAASAIDSAGFAAMLRLVADHGCWAKLSGAYRLSESSPGYADVVPMARALIDAAPDRVVWGSDWPHVGLPPQRMPNTGGLLNLLAEWSPDASLRQRILVSNPAHLYGFATGSSR